MDWRRATRDLEAVVVLALDREGGLRWCNRGFSLLHDGEAATAWQCVSSPALSPWLGLVVEPGRCLHEGLITLTGSGQLMVTLSGRIEADHDGFWIVAGYDVNELQRLPSKLLTLNTELQRAQRELARTNRLLRQREAELEAASRTDALTGVGNRLALTEVLAAAHARRSRYGEAVSLVVLDIDHFKRINDGFGHAAGDSVLRAVAGLLRGLVRETDHLARFGGEEFIAVLPSTGREEASRFAERVREAVAALVLPAIPQITLSAGVVEWRIDDDADSVFKRGDAALYRAKAGGRNRVVLADD